MTALLPNCNRARRPHAAGWISLCVLSVCLNAILSAPCFAQGTILPTDINRQTSGQGRNTGNKFELKLLRKLPAAFYLDANVESSFRTETNPFQYPTKRTILHREVPFGTDISQLGQTEISAINQEVAAASSFNGVFRVNPNITVGWSPTGQTQYFATYFLIRDSLLKNSSLNSTTQAIGFGAQHTIQLGKKASIQPQLTIREMYQTEQIPVLDYLPAVTVSYNNTQQLTTYITAMLQCRFKHFVIDPMRELDPFYTVGCSYQKGRWSFSANGTFNQNFRHQYGPDALLPINNYSMICDFEADRQLFSKLSGVQAFVRAEPVWNFSSNETNGLSGMDFRLYYGIRTSVGKPALTGTMDQLRQQIQHAAQQ